MESPGSIGRVSSAYGAADDSVLAPLEGTTFASYFAGAGRGQVWEILPWRYIRGCIAGKVIDHSDQE